MSNRNFIPHSLLIKVILDKENITRVFLKEFKMEAKLEKVALHITRVCNQKCVYCYLGDDYRSIHPDDKKINAIIRELAAQEVKEIYFVGGDPCCYPDLLDSVRLSYNLGMNNSLLSNSLDFGVNLEKIIKYVHNFEATFLGSTPEEHDEISGKKGSYDTLISNIKKINEKGVGVGIVLNATPDTYNKLYTTVQRLDSEKIKIKFVMIQRVIPRGRSDNNLNYCLKGSQVEELFKNIERISNEFNVPVVFEDPVPFCIIDKKYHKYVSRCEWGFSKGGIDENGNLSRCGADSRYQIGNIFITNLQDLWKNSPILKDFRSYRWLPEKCHNCQLLKRCGGGCSLSRITNKDHDIDILFPLGEK